MTKITSLALVIVGLLGISPASAQASGSRNAKITAEVISAMQALPTGKSMSVIVNLKDRPNLAPFRNLHRRSDRLREVGKALRKQADVSQSSVRTHLERRRGQGKVSRIKPFWVFNGLSITATAEVIQELAARADVASITSDEIDIVPTSAPPEPNISVIGVPNVWGLGYFGRDIVVANLDSGVDYTHPDLVGKWRGGTNSWFDPYAQHSTPYDPSGHGTLTMGVMVGGDAGGTSIGVAPQAKWIAAKIYRDTGSATATAIHEAFQWILDPDGDPATADAPDVVNNSWAFGSPGCNLEFQPDLQALVTAGIVPVFSAGNYGSSGLNTSVSPANYPEALSVGAVDNADQLYFESSQGPSACGESSRVYPDLVAPGVNISSTAFSGLYTSSTGTSLAAPHVAGALAVLLSAYPDLTVAQQRDALVSTAVDLGDLGPDNSFGVGRLDLLAAFDWAAVNIGNPLPVDSVGPIASAANASPNPSNGILGFDSNTLAVRLSATLSDPGLQSNVQAVEVFIDTVGSNGNGVPLLAVDGSFDSPEEAAYADLPLTTIAQLSDGAHTLYVHGQDAAGNWGATADVSLLIDRTAPTINTLSAALTNTAINLTASATDLSGSISSAEWFEGTDPGFGLGMPMSVSGSNLAATISLSTLTAGNHVFWMRALDGAGNWSALASATVNVPLANVIFTDGFESGDFSAWNGSSTGNRLTVNTAATMIAGGNVGMQATLGSGNAPGYVTDLSPALEKSYHARFYFNPNGANTRGRAVTIFTGFNAANRKLFQVQFRRSGGKYQVRSLALKAGGTGNTKWVNLTDNTAHSIEIAWQSDKAGCLQFYTDGMLKQTLYKLNTSAYSLDAVRLGPSAGLVGNASGNLYFDGFASTRHTVIGVN